ncbi:lasso peptide biosynthesis B2 protein [Luteimonas sp. XNQY3]|nr:lasso peptide biosynthesis B2 protein [Luteimonas sp. XNQY3]MCD9008115.1 lasso peptide biosynthesis B2 protein [Luteimonas sp. XNQY3]
MNVTSSYTLRDKLSVCQVDGHLVFLDIDEDRYFRLPQSLEEAFNELLSRGQSGSSEVSGLLHHRIIVPAQDGQILKLSSAVQGPNRSSLERASSRPTTRVPTVIEVGALTYSTKWQLKKRRLRDILDALSPCEATTPAFAAESGSEARVVESAEQFRRARRYVPVEPVCLLDSISMVRFLAKRGLRANIVFGITYDPFSAHCWVQAGDLALNDTVGNTAVYTPIRRV